MSVFCSVSFHLLYRLTNYTVIGTAFDPTLTVGMPATGPDDSQVLSSPDHWHRFTEVRSLDCSRHEPGPAV